MKYILIGITVLTIVLMSSVAYDGVSSATENKLFYTAQLEKYTHAPFGDPVDDVSRTNSLKSDIALNERLAIFNIVIWVIFSVFGALVIISEFFRRGAIGLTGPLF